MTELTPTCLTFETEMTSGLSLQIIRTLFLQGDQQAHQLKVNLTNDGEPCDLAGCTVSGLMQRSDGTTLPMTGEVSGGAACLTLPAQAYAVPGRFLLSMQVAKGAMTCTVLLAEGAVTATRTACVLGE
ncbi:MAG: hypothetical protein E7333_07985 [Clostridiales bacterium]|nr:hypothetical protein [Clostridiales bacterium]